MLKGGRVYKYVLKDGFKIIGYWKLGRKVDDFLVIYMLFGSF